MLIVRETFIAKPGMAGKLAKLMKEMHGDIGKNVRVMTDLTGTFNKVVVESEFASLSEFESAWMDYMKSKEAELAKHRTESQEMYTKGKRDIFRLI